MDSSVTAGHERTRGSSAPPPRSPASSASTARPSTEQSGAASSRSFGSVA
jgi:hypothetical protein